MALAVWPAAAYLTWRMLRTDAVGDRLLFSSVVVFGGLLALVDQTKTPFPVERFGLKLMSMGFLVDPNQAVIWRGPKVAQAVGSFLAQIDWGALDYLVIDLPPGTGDAQLTLSQQAPPPNTCLNNVAGHGITSLIGIFYVPAAGVTIIGSSSYLATIAGGVIAWTATVKGNGGVSISADPTMRRWPPAVNLTQ